MISTQLAALAYALLGFPFVLAAVAGLRALTGRSTDRVTVLATLYGCVVVAVAFLPLPDADATPISQPVQPLLFQWITDIGTELHRHHLPMTHVLFTSAFLQFALNVALFVPLGALLRNSFRVGFTGGALYGFAVSALIELAQLTANFGTAPFPYRVSDVDDLVGNTIGAVLGVALMAAVTAWKSAARPATLPAQSVHARTVRVG